MNTFALSPLKGKDFPAVCNLEYYNVESENSFPFREEIVPAAPGCIRHLLKSDK